MGIGWRGRGLGSTRFLRTARHPSLPCLHHETHATAGWLSALKAPKGSASLLWGSGPRCSLTHTKDVTTPELLLGCSNTPEARWGAPQARGVPVPSASTADTALQPTPSLLSCSCLRTSSARRGGRPESSGCQAWVWVWPFPFLPFPTSQPKRCLAQATGAGAGPMLSSRWTCWLPAPSPALCSQPLENGSSPPQCHVHLYPRKSP